MTNAHGAVGNTGMHCTQSSRCLPLTVVAVGVRQLLDSNQEPIRPVWARMTQCLRKSRHDIADMCPGDTPISLLVLVHYMLQLHMCIYICVYRLISHECERSENGNENHGWENRAVYATVLGFLRRVNLLAVLYRDLLGAECGCLHHRPNARQVIAEHMRLCMRCSTATQTIKCSVRYCMTLA